MNQELLIQQTKVESQALEHITLEDGPYLRASVVSPVAEVPADAKRPAV